MTVLNMAIIVLALVLIGESALLIWLWARCRQQERRLEQLQRSHSGQQRDIVGLCAAAVRMDERIGELIHHFKEMHVQIQDMNHLPVHGQSSYQEAIERIDQGAGIDDLVEECGISKEEAALLIRMHRNES